MCIMSLSLSIHIYIYIDIFTCLLTYITISQMSQMSRCISARGSVAPGGRREDQRPAGAGERCGRAYDFAKAFKVRQTNICTTSSQHFKI